MPKTINLQPELSAILKRKAVGPKGSRHLNEGDLGVVTPALKSEEVSLVSKAVLVVSVVILDRNELEDWLLQRWKSGDRFLPDELRSFFFAKGDTGFDKLLHKILQNQDLDRAEASEALSNLWKSDILDFKKGIFLIGERLKRESFEENIAFLNTMRQRTNTSYVDVPLLVDLSDPYDGFNRYPVYTPFVASVLAAMGFPTYCHGVEKVAPKYGDIIHKILHLAGKNPLQLLKSVTTDIENEDIRWGYLDQSVYFPAMTDLLFLRDEIVKRPFLATLEKLLQPLRSRGSNYLVTGYVHSHYKKELANLLKRQSALDAGLIVKGMEGATQVDFRKQSVGVRVQDGESFDHEIKSAEIAYPQEEWQRPDSFAGYCLETGIAALNGERNIAREILINQVVQIRSGLQLLETNEAYQKAQEMLDSGQAFEHWKNGCN